ncbi:hypothetical protein OAT68_01020 [Flavobacteriaceae bacterium]|nr:hypothetical protein [Flavobacteriaceae bacterium]
MKKLLYPIAFALTTFLILFSCSAEEEDTIPPQTVQEPTPEPEPSAPTQFTLTVTAGEGGSVSTEGGTFDEGTEVTISATPAEGYEFVGWEGSDSTEALVTLNLNSNQTISAIFKSLDLSQNLLNFYNENGGRNSFNSNQILALEALILGFNKIQIGDFEEAKLMVDNVFNKIPYSESLWMDNTHGFSNCKNCSLNIGTPIAYYGLRMLDDIIFLGNPEKNGTINMTVVIAPCAVVSRPTTSNLDEEIVNLNVNPKILENDFQLLKNSTALFRNWVKAITGGLEINLSFVQIDNCTNVNFNYDGVNVFSYPDTHNMINSVSESISEETDFWWVIAPSGVPGDGSDFDIQGDFITGGMGLYGPGLPVFISDDAWFTRKPEHMGVGDYNEIEIMAYMPQWFQHEFMHHLFRKWNEFGLEESGHQWFDRSTWPSDFIGVYESDYYAESIRKRFLNSSPSLSEGLKAPEKISLESNSSIILGNYRREPVENLWHEVNITTNNGQFYWNNSAGVSWTLEIINGLLYSGDDCPYGIQELYVISAGGVVTEIYFNNEPFTKI